MKTTSELVQLIQLIESSTHLQHKNLAITTFQFYVWIHRSYGSLSNSMASFIGIHFLNIKQIRWIEIFLKVKPFNVLNVQIINLRKCKIKWEIKPKDKQLMRNSTSWLATVRTTRCGVAKAKFLGSFDDKLIDDLCGVR